MAAVRRKPTQVRLTNEEPQVRRRSEQWAVGSGQWEGPVPALEDLKKSPYLGPLTDHFEVVFDCRARDLR